MPQFVQVGNFDPNAVVLALLNAARPNIVDGERYVRGPITELHIPGCATSGTSGRAINLKVVDGAIDVTEYDGLNGFGTAKKVLRHLETAEGNPIAPAILNMHALTMYCWQQQMDKDRPDWRNLPRAGQLALPPRLILNRQLHVTFSYPSALVTRVLPIPDDPYGDPRITLKLSTVQTRNLVDAWLEGDDLEPYAQIYITATNFAFETLCL